MLKTLFLAPGRLLAKLVVEDKKRNYRSVRSKPVITPGTILISVAFWFLILAGILVIVDKSGLLKQALDAGVEVAQNVNVIQVPGEGEQPNGTGTEAASTGGGPAAGLPESGSGTLSGNLNNPSEGPIVNAPQSSSAEAVETERWLVILHTIPKSARDEAERRQNQYRNRGLHVEIMDTDAFPRLVGGSWIIAQGPFDDRAAALEAANNAKEFNANLMVRRGL
ncbi:hypothetical protein C4J81_12250 [Deltaproteobacteria bacterium Smac51]|nr:hypothetical protein C4J81_12250 [Deltaproteobacteria bacterium Smac51]